MEGLYITFKINQVVFDVELSMLENIIYKKSSSVISLVRDWKINDSGSRYWVYSIKKKRRPTEQLIKKTHREKKLYYEGKMVRRSIF